MTPADVARVLGKAAAFDQRTVGETDVLAWHEVVGHLDFADALEAVSRHYGETDRRLMPVHLLDHARRARLERVETGPACPVCTQSTLGRYHQRHCEGQAAITATTDRTEDVHRLLAELREQLPDGDPDKLRRPEWVEADKHKAREARPDAGPNPYYDPQPVVDIKPDPLLSAFVPDGRR